MFVSLRNAFACTAVRVALKCDRLCGACRVRAYSGLRRPRCRKRRVVRSSSGTLARTPLRSRTAFAHVATVACASQFRLFSWKWASIEFDQEGNLYCCRLVSIFFISTLSSCPNERLLTTNFYCSAIKSEDGCLKADSKVAQNAACVLLVCECCDDVCDAANMR
jgi:hypothetical protein